MSKRLLWILGSLLMVAALVLSGCAVPTTPAPAAEDAAAEEPAAETAAEESADAGAVQIPEPVADKFSVAFVYVGPIGDGGYTYAHDEGRRYVEELMGDAVHTAYIESVPEGADAERVIRNLARAGFDGIITTSFGFMDPTATVAAEFPDTKFVHVSGYRKAENFSNLFGAVESMKYLAGYIAGTKAAETGANRVGYIAPFPIPEVIRHINAATLGMREACADCEMDIRWTFSWFDPSLERESAESLIDSGATVVVTGADTPGPVQVAGERGVFGIGYDSRNACSFAPEACLTVPYWNWGPEYARLIQTMIDGTFVGEDVYFDVDSGSLGLYGFMEGEEIPAAVPADAIPWVQEKLAQMQAGEFDRFDIFTGPINDNQGNVIIPEGVSLTQSDIEGLVGVEGREDCTICMGWLAEGVVADAQIPE